MANSVVVAFPRAVWWSGQTEIGLQWGSHYQQGSGDIEPRRLSQEEELKGRKLFLNKNLFFTP